MANPPALETARLRIVPFDRTFLSSRYVSWLNDPEVVRYSEQRHRRHTLESCAEYWGSFEGTPHYFCAILHKQASESHIGNMTITVDVPNRVADIAIMIGEKAYWGQGLGAEAWIAIMHELCSRPQIRKLTAGTMAVNAGMLAVMRRSGMQEEGRRRRQFLWQGQEVDMVLAGILAEELLRSRRVGI